MILTKEQESCLNYRGDKTLLIKGVAGAGKSVVIKEMARRLMARASEGSKTEVAIFTFNHILNSYTKELVGEQGIQIMTLDRYISSVYYAIGDPKWRIYDTGEQKKAVIRQALKNHKASFGLHRLQNQDVEFWIKEIDWMKEMNVSTEDQIYYLGLQRKGRGGKVRMSAADRIVAFQIYEKYEEERKKRGLGDWIDYAMYLAQHAEKIPEQYKFKHVLIDEAQDLPLVKLKAAIAFTGNDMVIAMDMNQRIYPRYWTLKMLGIETTTKKLTNSMRTTKQIDALAESIRRQNDELLNEDDTYIHAVPEKEGSIPYVVHLDDTDKEKKMVTTHIRELQKKNANSVIGVIAAKKEQIKIYSAWMTEAGILHEIIERDMSFTVCRPGVKLVNVYNAKGLEFTHVIIPQFIEGIFPYSFRPTSEEEEREFLMNSRNLVYVAMTRARRTLLITYSGEKGSRFIGEMDPSLYKSIGEITYEKPMAWKDTIEDSEANYDALVLPNVVKKEKPSANGRSLKEYLQEKGLEVVDKRKSGGALWIIGEKGVLGPVVKEIGLVYGAYGNFSAGGRATRQRPGWFTQCKK